MPRILGVNVAVVNEGEGKWANERRRDCRRLRVKFEPGKRNTI